jgi:uncharacterized protein
MVERRYAKEDGQPYTEKEYEDYYGASWKEKWDNDEVAPEMKGFEDFTVGEEVECTVLNLATFGAFCDIGATQNALLHISQISNEFIANIEDKLEVGQKLTVKIKELDQARGRIGLTCREDGGESRAAPLRPDAKPLADLVIGEEYEGTVKSVQSFGAFVDIGAQKDGLVHISEIANEYIADINEKVSVGQTIKCKIKDVDLGGEKIALSCRDSVEAGGGSGGSDASSYYYNSS